MCDYSYGRGSMRGRAGWSRLTWRLRSGPRQAVSAMCARRAAQLGSEHGALRQQACSASTK
eukprot:6136176-Pleurochrysis_carterae.AAC.3